MNCPIDNTELKYREKEGLNFNYCPKCKGVWLSRNELDRFTSKSKEEYPDVDKLKFPQEETHMQSPGHFFGHIFDF